MCAAGCGTGRGAGEQCAAPYRHTAPVQRKAQYRARNPAANPLNRLLLANFNAFEAWLKNPPADRRPRPHRTALQAMEKYAECGNLRYGAVVAKVLKEANLAAARERSEALKKRARSWAACLARLFEAVPLICPACRVEMKPVAVILEDKELKRPLTCLGLPPEFPAFEPVPKTRQYCNSPPGPDWQLDPRVDQYDAVDEPSPED